MHDGKTIDRLKREFLAATFMIGTVMLGALIVEMLK
jgi:hypothetical protein